MPEGLSRPDILKITNRYIGVQAGYLGDFTYRSLADFFPECCSLNVDTSKMEGTSRQRFISVLESASPSDQGKIIRGVLERFPLNADAPPSRTATLRDELVNLAKYLEGISPVHIPNPRTTSRIVEIAIADAATLIDTKGATSGVDRVHTALHGHLIALCENAGISVEDRATVQRLFSALRKNHPQLQSTGPRSAEIDRVLNAIATIVDALQPVRNSASVAHPNKDLLESPEAMLVVNAARSILNYLDLKLSPKIP